MKNAVRNERTRHRFSNSSRFVSLRDDTTPGNFSRKRGVSRFLDHFAAHGPSPANFSALVNMAAAAGLSIEIRTKPEPKADAKWPAKNETRETTKQKKATSKRVAA